MTIHQQDRQDVFEKRNKLIVCLLLLRYLVIYLPLLYWDNGFEENTEPYDTYTIIQYVGRAVFIGVLVYCLSFFTNIKELKRFIYYRAACELFETIRLIFIMCAMENDFIHGSKDWEWQLGIFVNLSVMGYFIYKWKKTQ